MSEPSPMPLRSLRATESFAFARMIALGFAGALLAYVAVAHPCGLGVDVLLSDAAASLLGGPHITPCG